MSRTSEDQAAGRVCGMLQTEQRQTFALGGRAVRAMQRRTVSRTQSREQAYGKMHVTKKVRFPACLVHSLTRASGSLRLLAVTGRLCLLARNRPQSLPRTPKLRKTQTLHPLHLIARLDAHQMLCLSEPRRHGRLTHNPEHLPMKKHTTLKTERHRSSKLAAITGQCNLWSRAERLLDTLACLHLHRHLR